MKVKSESKVTQSCPTLSNPMDCSLPGSSVHGIFQARVLECGAIAFSILAYIIYINLVQFLTYMCVCMHTYMCGLPCSSDSKEYACNATDLGSIPGQEDPLEKGMATHSSILAWKIPWTDEPDRLQSVGLQRLEHN